MPRKKLIRFEELKEMSNVFEFPSDIAGKWGSDVFKNTNPIVLELGCGAGEYTMGLARMNPNKNFIGIDLQGERIWYGAKDALSNSIQNVAFLRVDIGKLNEYFVKDEVEEMWITFADPHPRSGREGKRLTSPYFLNIYKEVLKNGGNINLKTDSDLLYQYTLEVLKKENKRLIERLDDVYKLEELPAELKIQTYYEKKHLALGKTIKYLRFTL